VAVNFFLTELILVHSKKVNRILFVLYYNAIVHIGATYGAEIEIKNVGIDACRFRIRQPPLGTGLRVVFQPGLVRRV